MSPSKSQNLKQIALIALGAAILRLLGRWLHDDRLSFLVVFSPLVFLIPRIIELRSEIQVRGLRMQFGILDLWTGAVGGTPTIWMTAHLGQMAVSMEQYPSFRFKLILDMAGLIVSQCLAFYWALLAVRMSGVAEQHPWGARLDMVLLQFLVSAISIVLFFFA